MTGGENGGTVNPNAFGTGTIFVSPGAYVFPGTFTMTNNFNIAGIGTNKETIGAIRMGNSTVISGNITLSGDARIGGGNGIATVLSGVISGPFNFDMGAGSSVASNFTISNPGNSWTGNTTIVGRTGGTAGNAIIHLGADEVIPNGIGKGNLLMGLTGDTASTETLDLNGHNETVNGIVSPAGVTASQTFIENDVATPATLTLGDNNQTANFGGTIRDGTGVVSVTKIGTGVQTLSGANSYSGVTNVNNGAISVTGSLNAGGTVNLNTTSTASGTLYGTGSMGTVTTLAANGAQKVVINPGATGAGTFGTLTMAGATIGAGTDLQFDLLTPGASDQIAVGNLTFSGGATVSPSGTPVAGDYIVVQSSGAITGSALTLNSANDTRLTFAFAPTSWNPGTNLNSQQVIIRVTGQSAHLLWSGAADGSTWDLKTTQNWKNTDNANAQDKFFNGDLVTFDDIGSSELWCVVRGHRAAGSESPSTTATATT